MSGHEPTAAQHKGHTEHEGHQEEHQEIMFFFEFLVVLEFFVMIGRRPVRRLGQRPVEKVSDHGFSGWPSTAVMPSSSSTLTSWNGSSGASNRISTAWAGSL